ncbi:MAG: nucleotidyltransferase domain-containing protein [Deltaproteobacteria bacterium]|nr:nucleotidyltransferase domain-containing protein [Deltaproteobacteria bacterium]
MYLFGSHAKGKSGSASDVDIALFTDGNEKATMDLELGLFVQKWINRPVDVVILQKVSPILQHEVLRSKIRMFEKDPSQRAFLENRAFRAFLDAKYYQFKRFKQRRADG